ncbi:hypothetical protein DY000_02036640 [Brassica cretica]|uniref:Uncharacterized protein n=1 Tax=Brassica cretica TaxID=69181 RepID=A0ABQ7BDR3_BRACR|nr:hypothetical protein DY000_02036640 [Brassica cretica]
MLLPPLCLLGLSLVSPGVINEETDNDSGCFFGEVCVRNHLESVEQSNLDWRLISGAPVMTSSITIEDLTYLFIKEENRNSHKLPVFLEVKGIPEAEEAISYALATTTKTERFEG